MEKKKISIAIVLAALIVGAALFYTSNKEDTNNSGSASNQVATFESNQIIATVNGGQILGSDFERIYVQALAQQGIDPTTVDEQMKGQITSQVIDMLIAQNLLENEAEMSDIVITEEEVNQQIESIKNQFPSEENFQEALSEQGITEEELRAEISEEMIIEPYLEQELNLSCVTVTEEEVNQLYEEVVAASGEAAVSLEEVYEQLESMAIQQKIQGIVAEFVETLRSEAEIEILI
jgi:peptidyl-prolyl cis-trans isomerase SurA